MTQPRILGLYRAATSTVHPLASKSTDLAISAWAGFAWELATLDTTVALLVEVTAKISGFRRQLVR